MQLKMKHSVSSYSIKHNFSGQINRPGGMHILQNLVVVVPGGK